MGLDSNLEKKLSKLKEKNQYRSLVIEEDILNFSSNDYLGLARKTLEQFDFSNIKSGSTGSRLLTGNDENLEKLEEEIATWKGTEAALFFGSGYLANLGTISALAGPRDAIFSDELNHSCILDGIRLSGAKKFFYRNLDYDHLRELLKKNRSDFDNAFVITDSVFSMQGTCADLKALIDLKNDFDFNLYLDEAHATGTMAQNGAGLYADLVEKKLIDVKKVEIQMGTFSKACGVEGGYVAGSKTLIDYLINTARTFIYSTAPSPFVVQMLRENLKDLINAKDQRESLKENIQYLKNKLSELKLDFSNDDTAIFAINLETNDEALGISKKLRENGLLVKAIRPPTTPKPCLRVCLATWHRKEEIDKLLAQLSR